jgi:hypothetical protein
VNSKIPSDVCGRIADIDIRPYSTVSLRGRVRIHNYGTDNMKGICTTFDTNLVEVLCDRTNTSAQLDVRRMRHRLLEQADQFQQTFCCVTYFEPTWIDRVTLSIHFRNRLLWRDSEGEAGRRMSIMPALRVMGCDEPNDLFMDRTPRMHHQNQ